VIRALLLAALSLASAQEPTNPHGDPQGCVACHVEAPEGTGAVKPIVETCRGCHPTADMHPVGIKPVDVPVVESWPLEDGLLTCATCHAEPAHGGEDVLPPPYHRGGPYDSPLDLCYACHQRSNYTRDDPHHPDVARDPEDGSCSACHTTLPTTGASPEESNLRDGPADACSVCHDASLHAGATEHLGGLVDAARRAELPATVALQADGRVQCWSCHEVHGDSQPSTAKNRRPLAESLAATARAEWGEAVPADAHLPGATPDPAHPPLLSLPVDDSALCTACHGDGP
jgi:hypothetical protein